jgi:hypothetical protein
MEPIVRRKNTYTIGKFAVMGGGNDHTPELLEAHRLYLPQFFGQGSL